MVGSIITPAILFIYLPYVGRPDYGALTRDAKLRVCFCKINPPTINTRHGRALIENSTTVCIF